MSLTDFSYQLSAQLALAILVQAMWDAVQRWSSPILDARILTHLRLTARVVYRGRPVWNTIQSLLPHAT